MRNIPHSGCGLLPAEIIFGRPSEMNLYSPIDCESSPPPRSRGTWRDAKRAKENTF